MAKRFNETDKCLILGFNSSAWSGERYFHVNLYPSGWESIKTGSLSYGDILIGMMVSCQTDAEKEPGTSYAWRVNYQDISIGTHNLDDADRRIKEMRRIARALDKLVDQFGRPETFGRYVARVAQVLGIGLIVQYNQLHEYWQTMTPGEAVDTIDQLIRQFHDSCHTTAA